MKKFAGHRQDGEDWIGRLEDSEHQAQSPKPKDQKLETLGFVSKWPRPCHVQG